MKINIKKIILLSCSLGLSSGAMSLSLQPSNIDNQYEPVNGVIGKNTIYEDNTIYFTDQKNQKYLDIYQVNDKYYLAGVMGRPYEINICGGVKDVEYKGGYQYVKNKELVVVSVDGLNVLSGQPANFNQGGYVIDKKPSRNQNECVIVKGWRKGLNEVAQFNFTNLNRTYNARTRNDQNNIGVIGFAFFDEAPIRTYVERPNVIGRGMRNEGSADYNIQTPSGQAMEASPQMQAPAGSSRGMEESNTISMRKSQSAEKIGTGHGQIIRSETTEVNFIRETEYPNKVITVEYKTYEELEQMGIIRRKREANPNAFPGRNNRFAPDPKY